MRKYSKYLVVAGALAALAAPSASMAAAPNGTDVTPNPNAAPQTSNQVAINSSAVTQNGQWVSGHNNLDAWWTDQTVSPGSRGVYVQSLLGHDGNGKPGVAPLGS